MHSGASWPVFFSLVSDFKSSSKMETVLSFLTNNQCCKTSKNLLIRWRDRVGSSINGDLCSVDLLGTKHFAARVTSSIKINRISRAPWGKMLQLVGGVALLFVNKDVIFIQVCPVSSLHFHASWKCLIYLIYLSSGFSKGFSIRSALGISFRICILFVMTFLLWTAGPLSHWAHPPVCKELCTSQVSWMQVCDIVPDTPLGLVTTELYWD